MNRPTLALSLAVLALGAVGEGDPRDVAVPRAGLLPPGARSFLARREAAVYALASRDGDIVGRTVDGAGFTLRGSARGPGCVRLFVAVGDGRWVCGDDGVLRPEVMIPRPYAVPRTADALPWGYAFTTEDGTRVFPSAAAALAGEGSVAETWEAHWAFAVRSVVERGNGRALETLDGRWLRRGDVFRAEPSGYTGGTFAELSAGGTVPFGWVVSPSGARTWRSPEAGAHAAPGDEGEGRLARLTPVRLLASRRAGGSEWARVDGGLWVSAASLRVFTPEGAPAEVDVAAHERWIDVDLGQQVLAAYEGAVPVYATLVSTGGPGAETRPGVWRIWGKYAVRTMDNTENGSRTGHYRLGDVPYVQFFDQDRGLHGVYWHEDFGNPRSHGCVNLAPRDAAWLFGWTTPSLPDGWQSVATAVTAVTGTVGDRGTVVRVRGVTPARE